MVGVLRAECSKVLQEMNLFCLNNEITEPESSLSFGVMIRLRLWAMGSDSHHLDAIAAI